MSTCARNMWRHEINIFKTKMLCIKLVNYWDKYTETHGQQNVKIYEYDVTSQKIVICHVNLKPYKLCELQLTRNWALAITWRLATKQSGCFMDMNKKRQRLRTFQRRSVLRCFTVYHIQSPHATENKSSVQDAVLNTNNNRVWAFTQQRALNKKCF